MKLSDGELRRMLQDCGALNLLSMVPFSKEDSMAIQFLPRHVAKVIKEASHGENNLDEAVLSAESALFEADLIQRDFLGNDVVVMLFRRGLRDTIGDMRHQTNQKVLGRVSDYEEHHEDEEHEPVAPYNGRTKAPPDRSMRLANESYLDTLVIDNHVLGDLNGTSVRDLARKYRSLIGGHARFYAFLSLVAERVPPNKTVRECLTDTEASCLMNDATVMAIGLQDRITADVAEKSRTTRSRKALASV